MDEIQYDTTSLESSSCFQLTVLINSNLSIAELFAWDAAGVPAALTGEHIVGLDLIKLN